MYIRLCYNKSGSDIINQALICKSGSDIIYQALICKSGSDM